MRAIRTFGVAVGLMAMAASVGCDDKGGAPTPKSDAPADMTPPAPGTPGRPPMVSTPKVVTITPSAAGNATGVGTNDGNSMDRIGDQTILPATTPATTPASGMVESSGMTTSRPIGGARH